MRIQTIAAAMLCLAGLTALAAAFYLFLGRPADRLR